MAARRSGFISVCHWANVMRSDSTLAANHFAQGCCRALAFGKNQ
jgi:hypothetical protein